MRGGVIVAIVLLLSIFSVSITYAQTSSGQTCQTEVDCTNGGAPYCECSGVQKSYCLDGESWFVVDYRCEDTNGDYVNECVASKTSSSSSDYTCENGASVWNNNNESALTEWCSDGKDNDYDGLIDCSDTDCASLSSCAPNCGMDMNITGSCKCGGDVYSSGYCCSDNTWASSSLSCPSRMTCSAGSTWYCYTESECTGVGGKWCSNYCYDSTYACPSTNQTTTNQTTNQTTSYTCSSSQKSYCYSESECTGVGGKWCSNYCYDSTYACPSTNQTTTNQTSTTSCSYSQLSYCTTQSSCEGIGGKWCSNVCYDSTYACPSTNQTSTNQTTTNQTTTNQTTTYTCSSSQYWNCYDETSCKDVSGYWCSGSSGYGWCQSNACPKCDSANPWNCYTESECTGVSAEWCTGSGGYGWCQKDACPTCSSSQAWTCYTKDACTSVGAKWCGNDTETASGWCQTSSCPTYTCSASEPWNCKTDSACKTAGASWCLDKYGYSWCQTSACPTLSCSASEPWNCACETECKNANANWCLDTYGNNWCQTGACPTYDCSLTSPWNCNSTSTCTNAGAKWCTSSGDYGWCQKEACPSCTSSQLYNCYSETNCTTAGGSWCGTWCQKDACPTCESSKKWNCYDKTSCEGVSGYWCTGSGDYGWCQDKECAKCDSSNLWNCYSDSDCTNAGGEWCKDQYSSTGWCSKDCPVYSESDCTAKGKNWCKTTGTGSGWCQSDSCPTYTCTANEPWNCNTETKCKEAKSNWCGTWCQKDACPSCSSSQAWNCGTKDKCETAGAKWCSDKWGYSWCQSDSCPTYTCTANEPWNCLKEETCKSVSGVWCLNPQGTNATVSGWCSQAPYTCPDYSCTSSNPWNCNTETDCGTAGANWCTGSGDYGWCQTQDCPTCDSANPWNCYTESECTGVSANWCTGYKGYSWCQSEKCQSCSSTRVWECYTKTDCTGAGGKWCGSSEDGWCNNIECPTCSKSQPWNCFTESDCKNTGASWCGTWCQESQYTCPSMTKAGLKLVGEIPEGCAEVIDATGVSKIVCETDKKACPIVDPSWETKCVEHNGIPEYKLDNNNCKFLECRFEKINETSKLWEKSVCPTPDENKEFVSQCQTFGGVASYIKKGGCNFVSCERKEQDKCINVDSLSPKILKDIEIKCSNQGLSVVRDYNANGCEILTCGDSENYCQSLSSEAYTQCKGELLVEKDSEGCVTFVQCVERGDTSVSLASHEKLEEVPDASILLGMVLRLEELKTKFLELSDKLEGIADFYEQKNDSNSERFQRASKLLLTASEEIEGVLDFLSDNIDALRVEDVEDIKIEIRRIRKVTLKDVLYIMLSTDNDVKQITSGEVKDCGADEDCFNFALRLCKPARMSPGEGVEALIVGLEEGNCIMDVSQSELGMTCKISKYSAGFSDPEKDILPFCEGELKEVMDNA